MPLAADRVKETTTTTGTGAITLAGAASGFVAFSDAFSDPSSVYYAIVGTTEWEVGIGTFTTTLSRDTVLASSNAGSLVNFSSGTKDVFSTMPSLAVNAAAAFHAESIWNMYQGGNNSGVL